jgi:sec-independent protein translocase protein TatA
MNFNPFSPEGLIVLLVLVLIFGSKRLPDAARSIGRSMRIFKAETKGLRGDDDKPAILAAGDKAEMTDAEREAKEFAEWKAARAAEKTETR